MERQQTCYYGNKKHGNKLRDEKKNLDKNDIIYNKLTYLNIFFFFYLFHELYLLNMYKKVFIF